MIDAISNKVDAGLGVASAGSRQPRRRLSPGHQRPGLLHGLAPRRWIMLDEHGSDDDDDDKTTRRLFVNAATVRFLCRDVRQLRSLSFVVTTAGGLLVLAEREPPQAARVLNPFTRFLTRFMAPVPPERFVAAEVVGASSSSSSSTLVLVPLFSDTVYWADAGSERFCSEKHGWLSPSTRLPIIAARYGGGAGEHRHDGDDYAEASKILETRLLRADVSCWSYVVDTADGCILIILKAGHSMDVYRMDSAGAKVERVRNIGSRAVFLGVRCLVVDAGKLASMDANCIYYTERQNGRSFIYMFDIGDETSEWVSGALDPENPLRNLDFRPLHNHTASLQLRRGHPKS
ncbi:hypothetical protein ACP70R_012484 [Stipagrostis hirtigluma subsp. patula]